MFKTNTSTNSRCTRTSSMCPTAHLGTLYHSPCGQQAKAMLIAMVETGAVLGPPHRRVDLSGEKTHVRTATAVFTSRMHSEWCIPVTLPRVDNPRECASALAGPLFFLTQCQKCPECRMLHPNFKIFSRGRTGPRTPYSQTTSNGGATRLKCLSYLYPVLRRRQSFISHDMVQQFTLTNSAT